MSRGGLRTQGQERDEGEIAVGGNWERCRGQRSGPCRRRDDFNSGFSSLAGTGILPVFLGLT